MAAYENGPVYLVPAGDDPALAAALEKAMHERTSDDSLPGQDIAGRNAWAQTAANHLIAYRLAHRHD